MAAVAYLPQLLGRGLWEFDEVRWSLVARELLSGDHWCVLTLVGDYYPDKPPLYFWCSALFMALFGEGNPWSPRLLSAAAVLATGLLTLTMGNRLFGRPVGFNAALLWITSLLAGALAGAVNVDTFYVAWLTGAFGACALSIQAGRWSATRAVAFCLCVGAAMMSKGPIGMALPMAVLLAAWLIGVPLPRHTCRILAWCIFVSLAVTCLWLVAAARVVGLAPIAEQVGLHGFGYAAPTSWSHPRPFWYFLGTFWLDMFPVSLLFPAALAALAAQGFGKKRKEGGPSARSGVGNLWRRMRIASSAHPVEGFLLAWFFGIFLLHSMISAKRSPYIMPVFPAAALLVVLAYVRNGNAVGPASSRAARVFHQLDALGRWALTGFLLLLGCAAVLHPLYFQAGLNLLMKHVSETSGLPVPHPTLWQQGLMLGGGFAAWGLAYVLWPHRTGANGRKVLTDFMATGLLVLVLGGGVAVPMLDTYRSGRNLAEVTSPYLGPSGVQSFHRAPASAWLLGWYYPDAPTPKIIRADEPWLEAFGLARPPVLGVIRLKDFNNMRDLFPSDAKILGQGLLGTKKYYLIGRGIGASDSTREAPMPGRPL